MALRHSPYTVTDGLITYLDAGNPKSYNGDASIWKDLSGNEHHAYGDPGAEGAGHDDARFPTWDNVNGGRFFFPGDSKGMTILTDMGIHTEVTLDFWVYKNETGSKYLWDARTDGAAYALTNYVSNTINVTTNDFKVNNPETYDTNSPWWFRWVNIVLMSDVSGSSIWVDGEHINDSRIKASNSFDETLGQYFRIGTRISGVASWQGYMANIKIYNRILTESEIKQNYNALKGRFDL